MSNRDTGFTVKGTIVEIQRGGRFKVKIDDNDMMVICTLSGKVRLNSIKILVGDSVDVEISADDISKGRIMWRYK